MPSLDDVRNKNALDFDKESEIYTIPKLKRAESVFFTLTLEAAQGWFDWRESLNLDTVIWQVELPNDAPAYAYMVQHYEDAGWWKTTGDKDANAECIASYWSEGFHASEWENYSDLLDADKYEVLVPYHVAQNAIWTVIDDRFFPNEGALLNDFIVPKTRIYTPPRPLNKTQNTLTYATPALQDS